MVDGKTNVLVAGIAAKVVQELSGLEEVADVDTNKGMPNSMLF